MAGFVEGREEISQFVRASSEVVNRKIIDSLSPASIDIMRAAIEESERKNHDYVGPAHMLLALIRNRETGQILSDLGVSKLKVVSAIDFILGRGDRPPAESPQLSPDGFGALLAAYGKTRTSYFNQPVLIGPKDLLYGIVLEGTSVGAGVLESLGVTPVRLYRHLYPSEFTTESQEGQL
mgnify:CR=1 FL=1